MSVEKFIEKPSWVKVKWNLDPCDILDRTEQSTESGKKLFSEASEAITEMARLLVFILCASMVTTQRNGNVVKDKG